MADQPSIIPSAWAANNSTTETIPATTTESGKASWDQGFPVETSLPLSEGGIPPKYGDFNGVLNVLSQFCLFAQAGGQYAWSNTLDYSVGSIVLGTDGSIYRAAQVSGPSTAAVNPVGDTSGKWERIVSQSDIDALEEDIQDAMDAASDAASNASAAQSAVTTLDSNVVKKSGDQEIGGVKTFTSAIVFDDVLKKSGTAGIQTIFGGTTSTNGARFELVGGTRTNNPGAFYLTASIDSTNYKQLFGKPDGTLTWGGKDIITNGGDQTVGGVKVFSDGLRTTSAPLAIINNNITKGSAPSSEQTTYLAFYEKVSDATASSIEGKHLMAAVNNAYNSTQNMLQFRVYLPEANSSTQRVVAFGVTPAAAYSFFPGTNNGISLGGANNRWSNIYSASNVNVSSDERIKADIDDIPDAVLDAWGDVSWKQFKMTDAIAEKGEGKARLHTGLIAQRIDNVFKDNGLDASRYGLFCHDAWDVVQEEKDENGNVIQEAVEAGDMYSLRYEEALAMEAAYQRRRADSAEARISALERRLNEMEAVLASLLSPIGDETYAEPEKEQDAEQEGEE